MVTIEKAFRAMEEFNYYGGIYWLNKLIGEDRENPDLLSWRAQCHIAVGHYYDSFADSEFILSFCPGNVAADLNIATICSCSPIDDLRDGVRALEHMKSFTRLHNGKKTWRIYSIRAAVYAAISDFETAVRYSKKSLEIAPVEMHDRCLSRIDTYQNKMQLRIDTTSVQEALAFRELRCHACDSEAFFCVTIDEQKLPICCDCNWGRPEDLGK